MFKRREKEKFVIRPGRSRAGRTLVLVGSRLFVSERLVEATTWAEKHKLSESSRADRASVSPEPFCCFHSPNWIYLSKKLHQVHSRREQERSKLTSHPVLKGPQASESAGEQTHCRSWECVKQFPVSGSCFLCISRLADLTWWRWKHQSRGQKMTLTFDPLAIHPSQPDLQIQLVAHVRCRTPPSSVEAHRPHSWTPDEKFSPWLQNHARPQLYICGTNSTTKGWKKAWICLSLVRVFHFEN